MKKITIGIVAVMLFLGSATSSLAINDQRGGVMGFIAGCCFGIRAGAAYNDGKEIHWREWVMLIPYVNIVFTIWNGIDGANGMETKDYAKKYGSSFY
jgi:hypothetical protein